MLALVLALALVSPQGADKLTSVRVYVFTETAASGLAQRRS